MARAKRGPKSTEVITYYRDPYLKVLVKRLANGKCQLCKLDAPFLDNNHEPYLEEHHVKWLADGGEDRIDNVVAICPNCHRKVHILNERSDVIELESAALENKKRADLMITYSKEWTKKNKKLRKK